MKLLTSQLAYKVYTKNDRGVGRVVYLKDNRYNSEDIVFYPFFAKEGDPAIGAINQNMENNEWKTNRELFGRYLDDPDFHIGEPSIAMVVDLDIDLPPWMGERAGVIIRFNNDGKMVSEYMASNIGGLVGTEYEYEGEMTLEEATLFAQDKIKHDQSMVEMHAKTLTRFKHITPRDIRDMLDMNDPDDPDAPDPF